MSQGSLDPLIFQEVCEHVAIPPTHKVSPHSSYCVCALESFSQSDIDIMSL